MNSRATGRCVFFEPWSLGDVIIAAATLREMTEPPALACHSMWHPLLRRALADIPSLELIAVDLPYTTRDRTDPFDTGGGNQSHSGISRVLSVRGDYRDFAAARKIFPGASIRMTGWVRFFGRKSRLVNLPYSLGVIPVANRYRSWAGLAQVAFGQIEATYRQRQEKAPLNRKIALHVGAQWRSKQFPHVVELRAALRNDGWTVEILAGPRDPLPPGVEENDVLRVVDEELIETLRSAHLVITNDSGPMHVAAYLGCRTTALVRASPIEEWAPPATRIVQAPLTPRGYRPHPRYMSDDILPGWPSASEVVAALNGGEVNHRHR